MVPLAGRICYILAMLNDLETLPNDPSRLREIVSVLANELKSRDILTNALQMNLTLHAHKTLQ